MSGILLGEEKKEKKQSKRKFRNKKSRKEQNPQLEYEFVYVLDKKSGKPDFSKTYADVKSTDVCFWKCLKSKCGHHKWQETLIKRCRGDGCPFCSHHRICECESFAVLAPEVLRKEYVVEKNPPMQETSLCSRKKVFWRHQGSCCGQIHEWQAMIESRVRLGSNCPYCSIPPHKTCQCKSLRTLLSPELLKQWDETRNSKEGLSLDDVTMGSTKKAWWICDRHGAWKAVIGNRTSGRGCPICRGSKMELNMLSVLQKLEMERKIISVIHQFHVPTKPFPCYADFKLDFCKNNGDKATVTVEMDGCQHFSPVPFYKTSKEDIEKEFLKTVERDQKKDAYLSEVGISCLHISWDVQKDDYENIVLAFIANVKAYPGQKGIIEKVGDAYNKKK